MWNIFRKIIIFIIMAKDFAVLIDQYLSTKLEPFTLDTFYRELRKDGVRLTKNEAAEVLFSSNMVFPLMQNEFITRSGVFTGRAFSFLPTREEVQKGYFIIGHRAMPFINPEYSPDKLSISNGKKIVKAVPIKFSMNVAMETFSLFGEGYSIPYILADHSNKTVPLASIQYSMPTEITLTAWPLSLFCHGRKFCYGDRILAKVTDWREGILDATVLYQDDANAISTQDIEREDWYLEVEKALFESIEKNGPASSIEEQLAYLFLEHQQELCIPNCGSMEDFFKHTKRFTFSPYGVETRIWKAGEAIPFSGKWNDDDSSSAFYFQLQQMFSVNVLDTFLQYLCDENKRKPGSVKLSELIEKMFPFPGSLTPAEKKILEVQMEKRVQQVMKFNYVSLNKKLPRLRKRILFLFTDVSKLIAAISLSGLKLSDLPSNELIILEQLFSHMRKIIEEMGDIILANQLPIDDINLSVDGMEETFWEVRRILSKSLDVNTYKNIKIIE